MKQKSLILCSCLFMLLTSLVNSSDKILTPIYAYHLKPPYIISLEQETGLYFDFSRYLNTKAGPYQFHTSFIPRKRVEAYLDRNILDGALIGVNPVWFKDKKKTKYLWTSPIMQDTDDIISAANSKFEYTGPRSLYGKTLGGVLGFYYFGIDDEIKAGNILREDTANEAAVLNMILRQHVDVGIVSRSTYNYLIKQNNWQGRFYIAKRPHDKFTRHILVPTRYADLFSYLEQIVKKMHTDPAWQAILRNYEE